MKLISWIKKNILYLAWIQSIIATSGSLYASEIMHWNPCVLCWYQRILMYPLVIIIVVGIVKKDKILPDYVLPMTYLGMAFSAYQWLLQMGVITENLTPCAFGVSCTTKYIGFFGFMSLAFMAFVAFLVITICMLIYRKSKFKKL